VPFFPTSNYAVLFTGTGWAPGRRETNPLIRAGPARTVGPRVSIPPRGIRGPTVRTHERPAACVVQPRGGVGPARFFQWMGNRARGPWLGLLGTVE
jgi:hypothetical protein